MCVNELAGVQYIIGVHCTLDSLHDGHFHRVAVFGQSMQLFSANAVLAAQATANAINIGIANLVELAHLTFPFLVAHIHLQDIKMQVTVASVSKAHAFKVIVFGNLHQVVLAHSNFIHGHNQIVGGGYLAQGLGAF